MRFLANENIPGDAVAALRAAGCDVEWIRSSAPGMPDRDVLAWAIRDQRVLLTFDKDFGEIAWHARLPASCGIVLFRMPMPRPTAAATFMARTLTQRADWVGNFSVIERGRVRIRPLPA